MLCTTLMHISQTVPYYQSVVQLHLDYSTIVCLNNMDFSNIYYIYILHFAGTSKTTFSAPLVQRWATLIFCTVILGKYVNFLFVLALARYLQNVASIQFFYLLT